jgi:hypothetical protein
MPDLLELRTDSSNFGEIRKNDWLYVDKTQHIAKLLKKATRVYISRPRGFGKSLMVSVLENLYLGNKDLFKGLAIEEHLDEPLFQPRPVIRLDMSSVSVKNGLDDFKKDLLKMIHEIAEKHDVRVSELSSAAAFDDLITNTAKKYAKPAILIDGYDSPFVETCDDPDYHEKNTSLTTGFTDR